MIATVAAPTCGRPGCQHPPAGWRGLCEAHREQMLDERADLEREEPRR